MAVWRFVNLNLAEAQPLADLAGVEEDLKATVEICDVLLKVLSGRPSNLRLLDALTSAAIVRYVRTFTSGVRTRLPSSLLDGLAEEQATDHRWFIDLRDKYVAHSVNAFEENQVVAYLVPEERGARDVASISVQQYRLASFGIDDTRKVKALAAELRQRLASVIRAENERVLAVARGLSMEALYTQVDPPPRMADRADAGRRRK